MSTPLLGLRAAPGRRAPGGGALLSGLLVLGLVAGCGSSEPAVPQATRTAGAAVGTVSSAPDGVQEVTLETGDDYVFTPATFTVAPGPVRVTVRNLATRLTHNFVFPRGTGPAEISESIPALPPGDSKTIEFTVTAAGDYRFECSFHAALGQVGSMTVSAP